MINYEAVLFEFLFTNQSVPKSCMLWTQPGFRGSPRVLGFPTQILLCFPAASQMKGSFL